MPPLEWLSSELPPEELLDEELDELEELLDELLELDEELLVLPGVQPSVSSVTMHSSPLF